MFLLVIQSPARGSLYGSWSDFTYFCYLVVIYLLCGFSGHLPDVEKRNVRLLMQLWFLCACHVSLSPPFHATAVMHRIFHKSYRFIAYHHLSGSLLGIYSATRTCQFHYQMACMSGKSVSVTSQISLWTTTCYILVSFSPNPLKVNQPRRRIRNVSLILHTETVQVLLSRSFN